MKLRQEFSQLEKVLKVYLDKDKETESQRSLTPSNMTMKQSSSRKLATGTDTL